MAVVRPEVDSPSGRCILRSRRVAADRWRNPRLLQNNMLHPRRSPHRLRDRRWLRLLRRGNPLLSPRLRRLRAVVDFGTSCSAIDSERKVLLMRAMLVIFALVLSVAVNAASTSSTFRDSMGRNQGTTRQNGNRTEYRDSMGRLQGTANQSGNQTTYRDSMGRLQGTARENGNQTTYRDAQGRLQATAWQNGNRTEYRDAQGRLMGTATTDSSGRTTYRDAQGRLQGTKK